MHIACEVCMMAKIIEIVIHCGQAEMTFHGKAVGPPKLKENAVQRNLLAFERYSHLVSIV